MISFKFTSIFLILLNNAFSEPVTCYDQKGQQVTYISDSTFPGPAVALAKNGSKPIIVTNPEIMNKFSQQTQKFILAHECSHMALGHLLSASSPTIIDEQQSDCAGIRVALTLGQIKHIDLKIIENEIANIGQGDYEHFSGSTRSLNIQKCLGEGYKEEPWRVCKKKFYSNLSTFKSAIPALKQMLGICHKFGKKSSQCNDAKNLGLQLHQGLTNSTTMVDQECPFVMDFKLTKVMFEYGQALMKLNNQK